MRRVSGYRGAEVDRVRQVVPYLVAVAAQLLGDHVAVGVVADERSAQQVAALRREASEHVSEVVVHGAGS